MLPSFARPAEAAAAITLANPEHPCEGEAATLHWDRPADIAGVDQYEITHQLATPTPSIIVTKVDVSVTSLAFTLPFGVSTFLIRTVSASVTAPTPFASAGIMGNRVPSAMAFDLGSGSVAAKTADVPFKWYGPPTLFVTGGQLPVKVTVSGQAPSGVPDPAPISIAIANPTPPNRVVASFTKLKNGAHYTFSAVTSNVCGSSPPSGSPDFVPGIAPAWTAASPPLTAQVASPYKYKFAASGLPGPKLQLVGVPGVDYPAWLTIGPNGFLKGTPPSGTTSFSYSVKAANGVGVWSAGVSPSDIVAGPFTVSVVP